MADLSPRLDWALWRFYLVRESGYSQAWIRRNYKEYLGSQHWLEVKKRYWASKKRKTCCVCGASENLQVHHRTYKRVGKERLIDLAILCGPCHQAVHAHLKMKKHLDTRINLWTAIKKYNIWLRNKHRICLGRDGKYCSNFSKKGSRYCKQHRRG